MAEPKTTFEVAASLVQVLSVIVGVVISVWGFSAARSKEADARALEAEARAVEAEARAIEADKAFVELRRSVYLEAVRTAAIIANPEGRSDGELKKARRRFRELYVAELSMVEDRQVESSMVSLARAVDPQLTELSKPQLAALQLAQALKAGYTNPRAQVSTKGAQ